MCILKPVAASLPGIALLSDGLFSYPVECIWVRESESVGCDGLFFTLGK